MEYALSMQTKWCAFHEEEAWKEKAFIPYFSIPDFQSRVIGCKRTTQNKTGLNFNLRNNKILTNSEEVFVLELIDFVEVEYFL